MIVLQDPVGIVPAQLPEVGLLDDLQSARELRGTDFTAVGYGAVRETRTGGFDSIQSNAERRYAVQSRSP